MNAGRERMLLYVLAGIVVLWFGHSLYQSMIVQPLEDRKVQRDGLLESKGRNEIEKRRLLLATERLKSLGERSLPPDPLIAQAQYQAWLIEEAAKAKLTSVSIESVRGDSRPKGDTYYGITATIKARGTLDRVCDFLHAFYQSGILHRVNNVSLEAEKHDGNPELAVSITVEALALLNSPQRNALLVDATKPLKPESWLRERSEYGAITAKNLFVATYKGPPKPERPKTQSPVEQLPDTAEFVYLSGSVARGDRRDAMLWDRTTGKKTDLVPGGAFSVAGLSGKVVSIESHAVVFEIDGDQWRLELGKNLRQMEKMQKAGTTTP